jgi:hypothetical protein
MSIVVGMVVLLALLAPRTSDAQTGNEETICTTSAVFFCENFEDRVLGTGLSTTQLTGARYKNAGWISGGGDSAHSIIASPVAFGTKALRITYAGGVNNGPGFLEMPLTGGTTNWYLRFYLRYPSSFPLGCANGNVFFNFSSGQFCTASDPPPCQLANCVTKMFTNLWPGANANHYYHHQSATVGAGLDAHVFDQDGCCPNDPAHVIMNQNMNGAVAPIRDVYQCIEFHTRLNSTTSTPDGVLEGWIDGVQHWNYTGRIISNLAVTPVNILRITSSASGNNYGAGTTREVDNIIMSTQRIGCIGGLNVPANLQICRGAGCMPAMIAPLGGLVGLLLWARRRLRGDR